MNVDLPSLQYSCRIPPPMIDGPKAHVAFKPEEQGFEVTRCGLKRQDGVTGQRELSLQAYDFVRITRKHSLARSSLAPSLRSSARSRSCKRFATVGFARAFAERGGFRGSEGLGSLISRHGVSKSSNITPTKLLRSIPQDRCGAFLLHMCYCADCKAT